MSGDVAPRTKVVFMHAWGEWRPECRCGWTGSYWREKPDAQQQADRHFAESHNA